MIVTVSILMLQHLSSMGPQFPNWRTKHLYCRYDRDHVYDTEDCRYLTVVIEKLIERGRLVLYRKRFSLLGGWQQKERTASGHCQWTESGMLRTSNKNYLRDLRRANSRRNLPIGKKVLCQKHQPCGYSSRKVEVWRTYYLQGWRSVKCSSFPFWCHHPHCKYRSCWS